MSILKGINKRIFFRFCLQPLYNFPDSDVCEEDINLKAQVDKLWTMLTDQNQTYPIVSHFAYLYLHVIYLDRQLKLNGNMRFLKEYVHY